MPAKSKSSKNGRGSARKTDAAQLSDGPTSPRNPGSGQLSCQTGNAAAGSLVSKVFEPGAELTPTEALAASHWIRQTLAFITGIIFGALRLTGFPPIVTFCVISFSGPSSLLTSLHPLDLDEIKEVGTIQTEGFFPSVALFFLTWILSFTIFLPRAT